MSEAGLELALALGALERQREELSVRLAGVPAWAAMCQLVAREAAGESLEAVSNAQLKQRLCQTLDSKVGNWRQLAGLEAAITALKAVGIEAVTGGPVQTDTEKRFEVPVAAAAVKTGDLDERTDRGSPRTEHVRPDPTAGGDSGASLPEISDDVSAILNRIRSITRVQPERRKEEPSRSSHSPTAAAVERPASDRAVAVPPSTIAGADDGRRVREPADAPKSASSDANSEPAQVVENSTSDAASIARARQASLAERAAEGARSAAKHSWSADRDDAGDGDARGSLELGLARGGGGSFVEDEAEVEIITPRATRRSGHGVEARGDGRTDRASASRLAKAVSRSSTDANGLYADEPAEHVEPVDEASVEIVRIDRGSSKVR